MSKISSFQRMLAAAAVVAAAVGTPAANAAILNYSFSGIAGIGSSMDLGAGVIDLTNQPFTAYGTTMNDIDVFNAGAVGDGVGAFAATTTYDFGALGAFVTDAGGDFYLQNCVSAAATSCALLANVGATAGFRMDFAPAFAGDPDFGIAIGAQMATSFAFIARTQNNAGGDTLTIGAQRSEILSVNVTAAGQVPVPATLAIAGLGLLGLGAMRRRSAAV